MSTMKAVRIHNYGDASVLKYEDAPRPVPGEGEILIRVHATSINPFDTALRSGYLVEHFDHTLPLIPGIDVSGVVEATGPNTNSFSPGDAVYTKTGVFKDGSYAEFAVVPAADVVAKPPSLDHNHAAALPHVSVVGWAGLFDIGNLQAGQTVLIHGAAGGIGHVAVQLAKWRGATVIGTASTNIDLLDELVVDQAIDYSTTAFEDVVSDVAVVLDTIGGETLQRCWPVLKRGGALVSYLENPSKETAEEYGVKSALVWQHPPTGETLKTISQLVGDGTIKPVVSTVLPLHEASKGHQMIETRHTRGKIILQVAD